MLTKQHRLVKHIISREERGVYQAHMCGLCHALGDNYGLASRWLTNHDMILLNMLTDAQLEEETDIGRRRCPLNPLVKTPANQGLPSEFAAAVSVGLAKVSLADDVQDSDGWDIKARVLISLLGKSYRRALDYLEDFGFETELLAQLSEAQVLAEQEGNQDPATPSARASAALFALTARLTGNVRNESLLQEIGAHYGEYLYLKDALRDYPQDMARGEYNPFRRFSTQLKGELVLSRAGLVWANNRFTEILTSIRWHAKRLSLYHNKQILLSLLCKPVDQTITNIIDKIETNEQGLVFKRWQVMDLMRAATFSLPIAVTMGISAAGYDGCDVVRASEIGQLVAADGEMGPLGSICTLGICCGILCCLGQSTGNKRVQGNTIRDENMCDCLCDLADC
jgi:hypothetical protein